MKKKSVNLIEIVDFDTLLSRKDCFYVTSLCLSLFQITRKLIHLQSILFPIYSKTKDIMEGKSRVSKISSLYTQVLSLKSKKNYNPFVKTVNQSDKMIDNFIQKLRFQRKLSLLSITFVALIAFNGSLETRKALSRFVYKYWENKNSGLESKILACKIN